MSKKTEAANIAKVLCAARGIRANSKFSEAILFDKIRYAAEDNFDGVTAFRVEHVALDGIHYCRQTGRMSMAAELAIKAMNPRQYVELVAELVVNCSVMAEVHYYLNKKFSVAA